MTIDGSSLVFVDDVGLVIAKLRYNFGHQNGRYLEK